METRTRHILKFLIAGLLLFATALLVQAVVILQGPAKTADTQVAARNPQPDPGLDGLNQLFASAATQPDQRISSDDPTWISRRHGIELKGTAGESAAVVRNLETGQEFILHPGDKLHESKIKTVSRNTLVIENPDGEEILTLPSNPPEQTTQPGRVRVIQRQDLAAIFTDIEKLSGEMTIQPVRAAAGGLEGYRVASLKSGGLAEKMGLMQNDLLISVNSEVIKTPQDVYRTLESACHQNSLSLQIRRKSNDVELTYQIR